MAICSSDIEVLQEEARFLRWCKDDQHAAHFLQQLFLLSQELDDLEDQAAPPDTVGVVLARAMLTIPMNPWFMANAQWYRPLFLTSTLYWEASNHWAKSPIVEDRMFAFTYREILEQVIVMTAFLKGGLDWARIVLQEVHDAYRSEESFEEWEKEHECGQAAEAADGRNAGSTKRH